MKKHCYILMIVILLAMSAFLFFGCAKGGINPNDIDYIEFREGSLKTVYAVDEKLDFNNIYIVIVLKKNKGDIVERVLPSMLEGFDTSTTTGPTETRSMRAKYMGFYTTPWNYIVTNAVDIETNARIQLREKENGDKLDIIASLKIEDLSGIKGMMMDISYNTTNLIRQDIRISIENWEISLRSIRQGSFSILYYSKPLGMSLNHDIDLFVMVFDRIGTGSSNIEIKNIILSDGDRDIYLPDAKLK